MRILITEQGEHAIKQIEETSDYGRARTLTYGNGFRKSRKLPYDTYMKFNYYKNIPNKFFSKTSQNFFNSKNNKSNSSNRKLTELSPNNTGENFHITQSTRNNNGLKKVNLNIKKLVFPKEISDNYENDHNQSEKLIQKDENFPEIASIKKLVKPNEKLSLQQILGKKTVTKLKKELIQEEKMKNKLSRIDENKFRSNYRNFTKLEDLDYILNHKKINPNSTSLIRYISANKDITKLSLQNIIYFNNDEMFRANQICQNIFYHQNEYQKNNFIREQKIKAKHNNEKIRSNRYLNKMNNDLKIEDVIFQKYKNKVDKSEAYRERYHDMDKYYWRRYNIDSLMTKKYQKKKLLTESG